MGFLFQEKSATAHTLFHISNTSECHSGERLFLSRYLGEVNPFHHLITTQVGENNNLIPSSKQQKVRIIMAEYDLTC